MTLPATLSSGHVSADEDYDAFGGCHYSYSPPDFETGLSPFDLLLISIFISCVDESILFLCSFVFLFPLPLRDLRTDMIRDTMMTR
jgi:hypothetical protein